MTDLWAADLPVPEATDDLDREIFEKLAIYKGSTFDDVFIHNLAEPRIAVEILKLFIIHARVNILIIIYM